METMHARPILDRRFELAESPVWIADQASLTWVDVPTGAMWLAPWPPVEATNLFTIGSRLSAVARCANNNVVIGLAAQSIERIGPHYHPVWRHRLTDVPPGLLNDCAVDSKGRLWFGTCQDHESGQRGYLHSMSGPRDTPRRHLGDVKMSNGIGWSPEDTTMYFVDTGVGRVWTMAFDVESGEVGPASVFATIPSDEGVPDGLCVSIDGDVWVAVWGAGEVRRYRADGTIRGRVVIDAPNVTSCCFAGPALSDLIVTTAATEADPHKFPNGGRLFQTTTDTAGVPVAAFADDETPLDTNSPV